VPEADVNDRVWHFLNQNRVEDYFFDVAEGHDTAWWTHGAERARDEAFCACFGCGFNWLLLESGLPRSLMAFKRSWIEEALGTYSRVSGTSVLSR
jgi:hypothetical protein